MPFHAAAYSYSRQLSKFKAFNVSLTRIQRLQIRLAPVDADQLGRNTPFHGFGLVGHPDGPHAPFADLLRQPLPPCDDNACTFLAGWTRSVGGDCCGVDCRSLQMGESLIAHRV